MIRPALVVVLALAIVCQGACAQDEAVGLLEAADAARQANDAERAVELYRSALEVDAAAGYGIAFVGSGRCVGITETVIAGLRRLSPEAARLHRARTDARAVAAFERARSAADPYRALALV